MEVVKAYFELQLLTWPPGAAIANPNCHKRGN
jgi:hypothetical protein